MENTTVLTRTEKLDKLRRRLKDMGDVAIAFSGGVDSTFLACFATETLGTEHVTAVTAVAPNFAYDEIEYARSLADRIGLEHRCIAVELPELFWQNPKDRCYHCKKAVFSQLIELLSDECPDVGFNEEGLCRMEITNRKEGSINGAILCDGQNKDDDDDYRPGSIAAKELGVRSPLNEAGLTKTEIRETLKEMGISIWDKPAFACLASRIPYNTEITVEKLKAIYDIETALKNENFTQMRARLHDKIVRLELLPEEMTKLAANRRLSEKLQRIAQSYDFEYVTIDLRGYVMGSLNSAIL